jgi:hypothetical protein
MSDAAEQLEPIELPDVEFALADGIFIKQMFLERAGIYVPQHSHEYDHASMVAAGAVRLWRDGELIGDFKAPLPIHIAAGTKHTFMSLEPGTVVYCIHRTDRTGQVEVREEHQLNGAPLRAGG